MLSTVHLAIRRLRQRPAYALATLACLTLGTGATAAVGSVVNTLFFQSASVRELHRLAFFMAMREGIEPFGVSPLEIEAFQSRSRSFQRLGAAQTISGNAVNLTGGDRPERVRAAFASTAYFETLGVEPDRGRLFSGEEERSAGPKAVLIGHALWSRMGAPLEVIGSALRVDGETRQVVGVMPPRFDLPSKTDLWLPLALDFDRLPEGERGQHSYMLVGLLEDGVDRRAAEQELVAIASDLEQEFPQSNRGWSVALAPFRNLLLGDLQGSLRTTVLVLGIAVLLLLVVACVNAAHLHLARCLEREGELSLRSALGASRSALFREVLAESLLLSGMGAVLGTGLAFVLVPLVLRASSIHDAAYTNAFRFVAIDVRLLLFAASVSLLAAVFFGVLPAAGILRRGSGSALGTRGSLGGRSLPRWSRLLVMCEVGVSAALLVCAGLLFRSLIQLSDIDLGFRPRGLVAVEFTLPSAEFPSHEARTTFGRRVLARLHPVAAVEAAGMTTDVPLRMGTWDSGYVVEGAPPPEPGSVPWAAYRAVTPGYLEALGVTLVRGRTFTEEDRDDAVKVAVVSEELARRSWGDADPIGRRIAFPSEGHDPDGWWTIVGVVGDVKEDRYNFRIDRPVWYVPLEQAGDTGVLLNLVVRASLASVGAEVRSIISELYPDVAAGNLIDVDSHVEGVIASERIAGRVVGFLGALVALLASIGLYGVVSYGVRQRYRELGIRLALGASPKAITRWVLREGLAWTVVGLLAGFAGAWLVGRSFSSLLFQTPVFDPFTYGFVGITFLALSLLACYIPARRAATTDVVTSLRVE